MATNKECGSDESSGGRERSDTGMNPVLDELGYYLLAGAGGEGPATLMDEARRGEELGFGTGFISERWNVKEASSLVGAACAVTTRMQIATAATNHNTAIR